jgi:predicted amidophosphoribosyltransferase
MSLKLNHFICPNCGHDFYAEGAHATCDGCQTHFYVANSQTCEPRHLQIRRSPWSWSQTGYHAGGGYWLNGEWIQM